MVRGVALKESPCLLQMEEERGKKREKTFQIKVSIGRKWKDILRSRKHWFMNIGGFKKKGGKNSDLKDIGVGVESDIRL